MSLSAEDKNFFREELVRSHGALQSDMMAQFIAINKHLETLNSKVAKHEEAFMKLHLDNKDRDHRISIVADRVELSAKWYTFLLQGAGSIGANIALALILAVLFKTGVIHL